jgi:hypothetical protein
MVAGGFESSPDELMGKGVEEQQVGFEAADFVGDESTFAAFALDEFAAGAVHDRGGVAFGAAADVHADDPAVDPVRAGVIASAIGAGFPGHEGGFSKAAQTRGALHNGCGPRSAGRMLREV